jgi:TPR repeat protein
MNPTLSTRTRNKPAVLRAAALALCALAALGLWAPRAWADFAAGKAAFQREDYAHAYAELLPEAQAGNGEAEYMVGEMTADGLGTDRSAQVAADWYKLAARHGYLPAETTLALLYLYGSGDAGDPAAIDADPSKALPYLKSAADGGDKTAQYLLGDFYFEGGSALQDYDLAYAYTIKAAERGVVGAEFNAGLMSARGLGTVADPSAAYRWFALAAREQYPGAAHNRDAMRAQLNDAEQRAADAAVASFRPAP